MVMLTCQVELDAPNGALPDHHQLLEVDSRQQTALPRAQSVHHARLTPMLYAPGRAPGRPVTTEQGRGLAPTPARWRRRPGPAAFVGRPARCAPARLSACLNVAAARR